MKSVILLSFSLIAFLYASAAKADVYKCVTAAGKVVTSDRVIPECANQRTLVFKNNGALKKEIAPPLTAEEKRKLAEAIERKAALEEAEMTRQKEERFLLAHYKNEQDIQVARKKAIDTYIEKKRLTSEQLVTLKKSYLELDEKIQKTPSGSSNLASLNVRFNELNTSISKAEESLKTYDAEIVNIHKRFDETTERFRIIVGRR
jgi:hypothetical protein